MDINPIDTCHHELVCLDDPRVAGEFARVVVEQTRQEKNDLFLTNFADNLPHILGLPTLAGLGSRLSGHAGFIVGSGPGLAKNIKVLRDHQDKGLVIAASSAVKPLLAAGIVPDLAVVVEAFDTSQYLDIEPRPKCPLVLASVSHPSHFFVSGYNRFVCHLTNGLAFLFGDDEYIPHGGTAGSAGFTIGLLAGLNPLILVGQDHGFSQERIHVKGAPGDDPAVSDIKTYTIKGENGQPVLTHSAFFAALHWYAESARHMQTAYPDVVLVNASESGAHIPGVQDVKLEAFCRQDIPRNSRKPDIAALTASLYPPDAEIFRKNLEALLLMIHQALSILVRNPRTGLELMAECRTQHPFLSEFLLGPPLNDPEEAKFAFQSLETRLMTIWGRI